MHDKFSLIVWDPPGYGKSYPPVKEFTVDFLEKDADAAHQMMQVQYLLFCWKGLIYKISKQMGQ